MSYVATADWDTLPAAFLPIAKQHMRVDFADDDASITEYLAQAIGLLEQRWGLAVNPTAITWQPTLFTGASAYQCPVQPVTAFTVTSNAIDVSAEYALRSTSITDPVWLVHLDGTEFPDDVEIALTVGYATPAEVPPPMRRAILSVAASLYEHRESITTLNLDHVPGWYNDMMAGLWVPRV